jgi:hypothetical protein
MAAEGGIYGAADDAHSKAIWEMSKQYARDLLELAQKFQADPHFGDAIYQANVVLGTHALREGDVKTAIRHMQQAVKIPSLSEDFGTLLGVDNRLANYLLKAGERESVAAFLEQSAKLMADRRDDRRDQRLKDAAAIRAGRMPMSYQYMVTPR